MLVFDLIQTRNNLQRANYVNIFTRLGIIEKVEFRNLKMYIGFLFCVLISRLTLICIYDVDHFVQ